MSGFRVDITGRARADLDRLLASLAERSPEAAARLARQFEEAITRLETLPLSCGLAYENRRFEEELRHLLLSNRGGRKYRALFVIRGEDVVILAVRAPGERPLGPSDLEDPR